jgi:hypothetical protein
MCIKQTVVYVIYFKNTVFEATFYGTCEQGTVRLLPVSKLYSVALLRPCAGSAVVLALGRFLVALPPLGAVWVVLRLWWPLCWPHVPTAPVRPYRRAFPCADLARVGKVALAS